MTRLLLSILTIGLPLAGARADIPPPPGAVERAAAGLIRQNGHDCPNVTRFEAPQPAQAAGLQARGLNVSLAVCDNNRRFLVGFPPRRYGRPQPGLPPQPDPMVQPLP